MDARTIPFKKMNGLGNDFVVVDARRRPLRLSAAEAGAIADRANGIGCDQVILIEPSAVADAFMRVLNADGSEVGACGNATRCIAALLAPEFGRRQLTIETAGGGVLRAELAGDGLVTVDMGRPRFGWREIPLAQPCADTRTVDLAFALPDGRVLAEPSAVNVGNPHCIFWVAAADAYDLAAIGPALERHPLFPERANISLAEVRPSPVGHEETSRLKLWVWERGAGLTRACGTAACAAAVAGARTGRTGRKVAVELPGGVLAIHWREEDDCVLMTGPSAFEFDGELRLSGGGVSLEAAGAP